MDRRLESPIARLFRFDGHFNAVTTPIDARLSNGLCFSPAGERIYISRTFEREILVSEVDAGRVLAYRVEHADILPTAFVPAGASNH
jgi:hypothetical protein